MSARAQYLSLFQNYGIIDTQEELDRVNEDDFQQNLNFILSSQIEVDRPKYVEEEPKNFDFTIYNNAYDEIKKACKTKKENKVDVQLLLAKGRNIAADWSLNYSMSIKDNTNQSEITESHASIAPPEIIIPEIPQAEQTQNYEIDNSLPQIPNPYMDLTSSQIGIETNETQRNLQPNTYSFDFPMEQNPFL